MLPTDIYKWNDYLLSYTTENLHKKKTKQSPEYSSQTITIQTRKQSGCKHYFMRNNKLQCSSYLVKTG